MNSEISYRESLISYIWEGFKDAHGFRPRGLFDFDNMSIEELEALEDRISEEVSESIRQQKEDEERARKHFEKLVQNTIEMGAGDRETALRWIFQAEGVEDYVNGEYIDSYVNYTLGLSYNFNFHTGETK